MSLFGKNLKHPRQTWWSQLTKYRFSFTELLALVMVVVGAVLRLWNLPATMQFVGDQGRDALIVAKMFKELDPVFIGPVTSVGNMYLGPLYYYFMLPWLWLTYPSPVGPAYGVAILGILTVGLLFFLGRKMIGERAALIATSIFATTATFVEYSRFSWNPNPEPFIMVLFVFATWKCSTSSSRWWIAVAILGSILLQLHYVTLLAIAGGGLIWLYQLSKEWRHSQFWLASLVSIVIVCVSFLPIMLFDAKHGWLNAQAFQKLVFKDDNFKHVAYTPAQKVWKVTKETHGRSMHALFEVTIGKNRQLNTALLLGILGTVFLLINSRRTSKESKDIIIGQNLILLYMGIGILGTAAYEHTVFDHYIAFLFPITAYILGMTFDWWLQKSKLVGSVMLLGFVAIFAPYNAARMPLTSAGWQITDVRRTSEKIIAELGDIDSYALVLLSESKDLYAQNYRYYLYALGRPPVSPELASQAQAIVIINENQPDIDLKTTPIYEIATFPSKDIANMYTIEGGPTIMVLKR